MKALPSQEYLMECFLYDHETGILIWKERPPEHFDTARGHRVFNGMFSGKPSGTILKGKGNTDYMRTKVGNKQFSHHRIIWKMMTGSDPFDEIDHRDLNGLNNRWDNLRPASRAQNVHNKGDSKSNTSGFKGVSYHKNTGQWQARIGTSGTSVYLGVFKTPDAAYSAYCEAAKKFHGDFASFGTIYEKLG